MEYLKYFSGDHTPLFWVAVALLAMGSALLLSAAFWQMRRFIRSIQSAARKSLGRGTAGAPAPAALAAYLAAEVGTDDARASADRVAGSNSAPSNRRTPHPASDMPATSLLLQRLRRAGDCLEELATGNALPGELALQSPLKQGADAVEYVFKASRL